MTAAPVIDGVLTDACWKALGAIDQGPAGTTWVAYDNQALYIATIIEIGALSQQKKPENLWTAERIELNIALPGEQDLRLRAVAHPADKTQTLWEILLPGGQSTQTPKVSGVRMPGSYGDGRCLIEAYVPWSLLSDHQPPSKIFISIGHADAGKPLTAPPFEIPLTFENISLLVQRIEAAAPNQPDRAKALETLAASTHPQSIPALVDLLEVPTQDVYAAVEQALKRAPPDLIIKTIQAWNAKPLRSIQSRMRAVKLVQATKGPQRYSLLLDLLAQESDSAIQTQAAKSFSDPEALPLLLQVVERDPDPKRRRAAIGLIASARVTDPQVYPILEQALSADNEWPVRIQAALTAQKLEDPRLIPVLQQALINDSEPAVRAAMAKTLGSLNDGRAINPLTLALRQDTSPLVREEAARALGRLNDPQSIPMLEIALKDENPAVRDAALESLNKLKPPKRKEIRKTR